MNEADARRVLWLQAQESAAADAPLWTAADREWATQAALQQVGGDASGEAFVAERGRQAMQRLQARGVKLGTGWRWGWLVVALFVGLAFGLLADALGQPGERIVNLLAPPVWAVIVWNLIVYVLLLVGAVMPAARGGTGTVGRGGGWFRRGVERLLARGTSAAGDSAAAKATASWLSASAPLNGARAALLMHAAAAAVALGVLLAMYLRALVFDYRAGWQSTFLDGATVHAWLSALLGPASALSGVPLPDVAGLDAMRVLPGQPATASAAPWIHLYAVTLALVVIVPRLLLALWQALRASRLARQFPIDMAQPYFQRLLRHQHGGTARVEVVPHAATPSAAAVLGLRSLLAGAFGDTVKVDVRPAVAFGDEDTAMPSPTGGSTAAVIALFDLTATPEAEQQGRLVQQLAAARSAPLLLLVDEAAFRARFGAAGTRQGERRAAWKKLAESQQRPIVFADLAHGDAAALQPTLESALRQAAA